jgi:hypothetical protein
MTGNDVVFLVDNARADKTKFPDGGSQLVDLFLLWVRALRAYGISLSMLTFSKRSVVFHRFPFLPVSRASMISSCGLPQRRWCNSV